MGQPFLNITKTEDNVHFLGNAAGMELFEKDYLKVREKEGRIFNDELVKNLPYLPKDHPLKQEWLYSAITQNRFCNYLALQKKTISILELGCGNGWFCNRIKTALPKVNIIGLDVNRTELLQAARVFGDDQIKFFYGDIFQDIFNPGSFDMIVMNSTVQYFHDFKRLINKLNELLSKDGEIHILDSPFYETTEHRKQAIRRSRNYFSKMGVQEMIEHYHHHTYELLKDYPFTILYKPNRIPNSLFRIIGKKTSPFPWIRINSF